jgi:hypothetical protein
MYLAGDGQSKSGTLVLHELWSMNPDHFLSRLAEFYDEDESRIRRVVAIGSSLDVSRTCLFLFGNPADIPVDHRQVD